MRRWPVGLCKWRKREPPQETDGLVALGRSLSSVAFAGSLALSGGHVSPQGPGQLRTDNGHEEFLGGQSAGQRQRSVVRTRLTYRAFLGNAFPLLPRTHRPADEVATAKSAKSS